MCEVSIIVPIFNTEIYLRGCISSLIGQSFQDIEIILVDDGSTDGCGSICDEYATIDRRIKVIHKANGGQQSAIISGVSVASGKWVSFVDSDDTLPEDSLEKLMNLTSEETDIIVGFSFPGDGSVTFFSIEEWRAVMLKSNVLLCTRWGKLFKKDILLPEVLVCPKGIKVGEDMIMNIKAAFHSDKPVTILHSKVYEYNRNDGSISYNYKWSLGRLFNLYLAVRDSLPKAMAKPEYYNAIVQNGLTSIKGIVLKGQKKDRKNLVSSALALQISKDVLEWAYAPSFEDRLLLKHSSSRLTRLYFMSKRMLEVLFQIIRRKLLKK